MKFPTRTQWLKVGKGALVASGGALATYLLTAVTNLDFGEATPLVVAAFSVLVNILRKSLERLEETN